MRLTTIVLNQTESAAVCTRGGVLPLDTLNDLLGSQWPTTLDALIRQGLLAELTAWFRSREVRRQIEDEPSLPLEANFQYGRLYRNLSKIWGIGLNYREHAEDLSAQTPTGIPGSFMKPVTTLIGPGEAIRIPQLSEKTTAEAELGVVIGRRCKDVPRERWLDVVAGFTPVIDMTAEDILRRNPRYLTVSKSFDTFFVCGPELVTPDEVEAVSELVVATVINGRVHAENRIARMTFPPDELVAFHSRVMTLLPGDIISTGTPGAVPIAHGDTVECRISGFTPLVNPVIDLKVG